MTRTRTPSTSKPAPATGATPPRPAARPRTKLSPRTASALARARARLRKQAAPAVEGPTPAELRRARERDELRVRRRSQLCAAATRVFERRGFEATVEEIAREAELAKGSFYVYFESREVLWRALWEAEREHRAARFERLVTRGRGAEPLDAWVASVRPDRAAVTGTRPLPRALLATLLASGLAEPPALEPLAARLGVRATSHGAAQVRTLVALWGALCGLCAAHDPGLALDGYVAAAVESTRAALAR